MLYSLPARLPGGQLVVSRYLPISLFFCHVICQSPLRRLLILNSVSEPTTQHFILFSLNCRAMMTAIIDFSAVNTSTYTYYVFSISCEGVNLLLFKHYVKTFNGEYTIFSICFVKISQFCCLVFKICMFQYTIPVHHFYGHIICHTQACVGLKGRHRSFNAGHCTGGGRVRRSADGAGWGGGGKCPCGIERRWGKAYTAENCIETSYNFYRTCMTTPGQSLALGFDIVLNFDLEFLYGVPLRRRNSAWPMPAPSLSNTSASLPPESSPFLRSRSRPHRYMCRDQSLMTGKLKILPSLKLAPGSLIHPRPFSYHRWSGHFHELWRKARRCWGGR